MSRKFYLATLAGNNFIRIFSFYWKEIQYDRMCFGVIYFYVLLKNDAWELNWNALHRVPGIHNFF